MKFSAQEEYGLRCLLQIARDPDGSLTIPEISDREGLSQTHVAKLTMILRREGFLNSTRGQTGGYVLAKQPKEIMVGEVLAALGGRLYDDEYCDKHKGQNSICTHAVDCSVRSLWQSVQKAVDGVLGNMTLNDLIETREIPNVTMFDRPGRLAEALS
jgi:Rrf2 family protein